MNTIKVSNNRKNNKTEDAPQTIWACMQFELATPEMMLPMEIVQRCTSHEIDDVHLLLPTEHSGYFYYW